MPWGQLVGVPPAAAVAAVAAAGVLEVEGGKVAVEACAVFPVRIACSL